MSVRPPTPVDLPVLQQPDELLLPGHRPLDLDGEVVGEPRRQLGLATGGRAVADLDPARAGRGADPQHPAVAHAVERAVGVGGEVGRADQPQPARSRVAATRISTRRIFDISPPGLRPPRPRSRV